MPQAALAAVVVAYSVDLIKPAEFRDDPPRAPHRIPLGGDRRSSASCCSGRCRESSSR